jgi:hypothetical protein
MQGRNVIRAVLFVLFFSVGTASLSSSILCDDLVRYYQNKESLAEAKESLKRLKSLNDEYDILLKRLRDDPNLIVERLAPATLGPDPNFHDPNTVYPRATAEQLAAARRALIKDPNDEVRARAPTQALPRWLSRCSEPRRRTMLLVCGAVLILTSFVCFRPPKQTVEKAEL